MGLNWNYVLSLQLNKAWKNYFKDKGSDLVDIDERPDFYFFSY